VLTIAVPSKRPLRAQALTKEASLKGLGGVFLVLCRLKGDTVKQGGL
jgi:hypothetical protein